MIQDDSIQAAISGSTTAENVTQYLIPKVVRHRYPDLSPEEVKEVTDHLLLDTIVKGNDIVTEDGKPMDLNNPDDNTNEGDRFLRIGRHFINIDKLSINLIYTINPFQRAYEVISKKVDAPTLKIIQDTIAEQKIDMTIEQAMVLFKPLKEYVAAHNGRVPMMNDPNPKVKELAAAYIKIKDLKMRKMSGLEYEQDNKDE